MSSSYRSDGYTPQNLRDAAMCSFKSMQHTKLPACPRCGKVGSYNRGILDSSFGKRINDAYHGHDILSRRPGPVLQCCTKCGQIFFNPANREIAITGHPDNTAVLLGAFLLMILTVAGYAAYLYFSGTYVCLTGESSLCTSHTVFTIVTVLCSVSLIFLVYYTSRYTDDVRKEFERSAARLGNTEYLKAMARFGVRLPLKYRNLINSRDNAEHDIAASGRDENRNDIYLTEDNCCGYCGCLLDRHALFEDSIGPAVIRCPQCHSSLYNDNAIELAAVPEILRSYRYRSFRKSQIRAVILFSALSVLSLVVISIAGYFLKDSLEELIHTGLRFGSGSLNFKLIVIETVMICLAILTLHKFLTAIFRLHRSAPFLKSFGTLLSESEHRMKNSGYAEKVSKGRKLMEERNKEETSRKK